MASELDGRRVAILATDGVPAISIVVTVVNSRSVWTLGLVSST